MSYCHQRSYLKMFKTKIVQGHLQQGYKKGTIIDACGTPASTFLHKLKLLFI